MKELFLDLKDDYRIICISDVHGNLPLLKELIDSIVLKETDYLILLGDLINRFPYSIECIDYIISLSKKYNVFSVVGNHEYALLDLINNYENLDEDTINTYTRGTTLKSILEYWGNLTDLEINEQNVFKTLNRVREVSSDALNYISNMYKYIETNDFLFVHSGFNKEKDLKDNTIVELTENGYFFDKTHNLGKTVVVGHWPTKAIPIPNPNKYISSNVLFLKEKSTIFIDGGNSMDMDFTNLKDIYGQLNALIINKKNGLITYEEKHAEVEDFYVVLEDVKEDLEGIILNYKNYQISVEEYDEDFYMCFAKNMKNKGLLLKEFYQNLPYPSTYAGNFLELKENDIVNLKFKFTNFSLVKFDGKFGLVRNKYIKKV